MLLEAHIRLALVTPGQGILIAHDLGTHYPMNGQLVDTDFTQPVPQLVPILTTEEVGRRTLQHRHMRCLFRKGRDHRRKGESQ